MQIRHTLTVKAVVDVDMSPTAALGKGSRMRWRRFSRLLRSAESPRGLLLSVVTATLFSSSVLAVNAFYSERFKNDLLTQFISEKISQIAKNLEAETLDWAVWNATYNHILGRNSDYYADEYNQYSFARTPIVAAFNNKGDLVSSTTWDFRTNNVTPLTPAELAELKSQIPAGHPLEPQTFLARFRGRPYLFSLQLVRSTDSNAKPVGRLLFTRPLDKDDVTFKASSTLNRALGVTHEIYGPSTPTPLLSLLGPLQIHVPLKQWQGVSPMPLTIEREARERVTALSAITALLAGGALLFVILLSRNGAQQRRLQLLNRRSQRQQQVVSRKLDRERDHDELTGLFSESGLIKAAQQQASRFPDFQQAIVYLDLDHFSLVNNGLGRAQANRVLQAFAERLSGHLHSSAALARVGADEFACCLMSTSEIGLRTEISALSQQLNDSQIGIDDLSVNVSVSIGASLVEDGEIAKALHEASITCSVVKVAGGHGHQLFGDAQASTSSYLTIQQCNQELVSAIREHRLDLFAQNAWLLTEGDRLPSVYVELLCRIRDAKSGLHHWNEEVIQAAQFCGSLPLLDQSVLRLACRDLQNLIQREQFRPGEMVFAINMTADSLFMPNFRQTLERLVEAHDLDATMICLEITEQAALRNPAEAITTLKKLRRRGFKIALDDFGTGMTSLGYLRDLPLDYVKIDKSFIRKLPHDAASQLIVQFVVELSKEIGFQTIAEGVEDLELLHQVQTLGITIAQGYLVKRPASLVAPSDQWCFAMAGEQQLACPPKETASHPSDQIN